MNLRTSNIPILSFFTGAGFLDMGFMNAGFTIVWHNEYNPKFIEGFNYAMKNMGHENMHIDRSVSIVDTKKDLIINEAFDGRPPSCFGVIGGPPCPDFSAGGKNRGKNGDNGRLSMVYVDRICELKPTFFLFENVPGLLRTAKHREFLGELRRQLREIYVTDVTTLNALEYGVPQDRQRVFMLGFHKDWFKDTFGCERLAEIRDDEHLARDEPSWFPWPDPKFKNPKDLPWPAIEDGCLTPQIPEGCPKELMVGNHIPLEEVMNLPNSCDCFRPRSPKFSQILEGDVSRKSFKRLHRWRFSPTAAYGNNEVHLHPTENRRLSVREVMRIQTVPDDYQLPATMTLTQKFKTVGNGVPVLLAEAVAGSIQRVLRGELP